MLGKSSKWHEELISMKLQALSYRKATSKWRIKQFDGSYVWLASFRADVIFCALTALIYVLEQYFIGSFFD